VSPLRASEEEVGKQVVEVLRSAESGDENDHMLYLPAYA